MGALPFANEDFFTFILIVHCIFTMYKYTEERLNLFLRAFSDRIAKEETMDEKSLQELPFFFPMFMQLSLSSSHILVDAGIMSWDL